jgi:hypothetical protein
VQHRPSPDGKGPWKAADRAGPERRSKGASAAKALAVCQQRPVTFGEINRRGNAAFSTNPDLPGGLQAPRMLADSSCKIQTGLSAANDVQVERWMPDIQKSPA